ncbi:MAG TPA: class I tRNA ligase family protein [Candidatus Thermoplasmatota archaeon]|nr:class I tRNA ligase family protein [Candidatus Thermoplasmatota archaeon]
MSEAPGPQLEKWSVHLEERVAADLAAKPIAFSGDGKREVWSIDTPPPYPSGKWHIGAVAGYSLIDIIARAKRMEGFDVLFPWGVDRNGINIELAVEKKANKRMQEWEGGRAAFNEACAREIAVFSDDMKRIARRVGLSCDYDGPLSYATDSPEYRAFSQARFLELFEKGLIVEDLRPNPYDPRLQTAIADADIHYEERKTRLNDVRWSVKETGESISISTTRPELICACRAVLVHPDNATTKHLVGRHAVLPAGVHGRGGDDTVPILAHPHVKTDFGSGIMMVCSYGDQADVGLFRELHLEPIAAIGMDGRMTAVAGPLAGLKVEEARKKAIELLEAAGLLASHKEVDQKFPKSERSGAAVEIILLKEWYVKQTGFQDDLRKVAAQMEFHPPKHRQLLLDWIDTVTIDWPVSRRRWYHTEIPLWELRLEDSDEPTLLRKVFGTPASACKFYGSGRHERVLVVPPVNLAKPAYYQPWREAPPSSSRLFCRGCRNDLGGLESLLANRDRDGVPPFELHGETKVFDTWMDSSVSNLFILRNFRGTPWGKGHVCSVRPQGRDIVRTWLYYTALKSWLLRGEKPFEHCWITGLGMDKQGRKMSKSLGNVVDPDEVVGKVGADAFRLWVAGESTVGDDFRINEEKIQGAGKFLQKLANVAAFVGRMKQPASRPAKLRPADEWILGELDSVVAGAVAGYQGLDFFTPANQVRSFVWNTFAPHYLEMVKGRAYAGDEAACWTLHHVLRTALLLLAPVCPFSTHYYAENVYGLDVHRAAFPAPLGVAADPARTEAIVGFNSKVWKAKQDQGLSLGAPIQGVAVPPELAGMKDELVEMHKLA